MNVCVVIAQSLQTIFQSARKREKKGGRKKMRKEGKRVKRGPTNFGGTVMGCLKTILSTPSVHLVTVVLPEYLLWWWWWWWCCWWWWRWCWG